MSIKTIKFLVPCWMILFSFPVSLGAQNIALNKEYRLSVAPNYQPTAPSNDLKSLTDGIYTKGGFWTKTTTVGWLRRQVTITIDLGSIQPVGGIGLNTCRNEGVGIDFPSNIFVFTSSDNLNFKYRGDAADNVHNLPGTYKVEKFCLSGINANARYIAITIVPHGAFIFTDEIEVYRGKVKESKRQVLIPVSKLNAAVDSLKFLEFKRKNLEKKITFLENSEYSSDRKSIKVYSDSKKELRKSGVSERDLVSLGKLVGKTHASNLRREFEKIFIVEKINPWDSLHEYSVPAKVPDTLRYNFLIPVSDVQYGGFAITSLNSSQNQFSIDIAHINNKVNSAEIFEVPFVPSVNFTEVADPLVPIKQPINIREGVSSIFLFKISGVEAGEDQFVLNIKNGERRIVISINTRIIDVPRMDDANLNAIVWAYLNFPMIKDRPFEAGEDLFYHHINTVDITPAILPRMGGVADSIKLVEYLKGFKGVKYFLILPNYADQNNRNGYKGGHFMSQEWKTKFISWYKNIISVIRNNGFPDAQVLLYPYDEIHGKDIADFEKLILWAKQSVPGIKFYATLGNKPAVDTLLPLLDIAQIHTDYKGIDSLPAHKGEVWMYSVKSAARSLSPYGYYRLMAWRAFANDFTGIGFWNYADEGRDKVLNLISDPFTNPATSFSVIYDGPGKEIISSRRWEAFRLGIEDYSIITAYSKKFGVEKAKALVQQVLDNPQNLDEADKVRNEMIGALEL